MMKVYSENGGSSEMPMPKDMNDIPETSKNSVGGPSIDEID